MATKPNLWQQNGPTDQAICLVEINNRISVEITGSATLDVSDYDVQRVADLITSVPIMARLLVAIEPHLDAIVCFASTTDEHEPNATAADIRGLVGDLRDCGALEELGL